MSTLVLVSLFFLKCAKGLVVQFQKYFQFNISASDVARLSYTGKER